MDNLPSHKVAGVRGAVEAARATLRHLPPYSPDLNLIEQVFAKLKALLRSEAARTVEALWAAIGRLLKRFQPAECARYLAHCTLPTAATHGQGDSALARASAKPSAPARRAEAVLAALTRQGVHRSTHDAEAGPATSMSPPPSKYLPGLARATWNAVRGSAKRGVAASVALGGGAGRLTYASALIPPIAAGHI
ncbi:MAG: Mobile element protein [uncultured Acetobacteraceae bacterium]|uniref:Mobile element protein n=1 Tax=uncultured Acetobacteraceae bacterium TaxID=169975 RepID=A0A6J4H882_9PROT|nr:MAG: Mobile element protein [uncultured Acetobacteraceae bacterium]